MRTLSPFNKIQKKILRGLEFRCGIEEIYKYDMFIYSRTGGCR